MTSICLVAFLIATTSGAKPKLEPDGKSTIVYAPIEISGHKNDIAVTIGFANPGNGRLIEADVVLNSSASEGGMANSVLEALAVGRAVLAADIPGNCSVIEHGVTGFHASTPAQMRAILRERYARGEIYKQEFDARRRDLGG